MTGLSAARLDALLPSLTSHDEVDRWEAARREAAGNPLAVRAAAAKAAAVRARLERDPTTAVEKRAATLLAQAYSVEQVLDLVYQLSVEDGTRFAAIHAAEIVLASGEPGHVLELYRLLAQRPALAADLRLLGMISRT